MKIAKQHGNPVFLCELVHCVFQHGLQLLPITWRGWLAENFIHGVSDGTQVAFGPLSVPVAALDAVPPVGKVTFSVRPQSMRLSRGQNANGAPQTTVTISERAYLGEFWDYVVAPAEGALRLRVTAPPLDVYQVGDPAWLELDPSQMAPIT